MSWSAAIKRFSLLKGCRTVVLLNRSWRQLSSQTRAEKRQLIREQIRKELGQGYVAELKEFRANGAKRSEAPTTICEQKDGLQFPAFDCITLSQRRVSLPQDFMDRTTLVLLSMRGVGLTMCDTYRQSFVSEFQDPNLHLFSLEICLVDNWFFRLIRNTLESRLREKLKPSTRHDQFVCQLTNARTIRSSLSIHNSLIGYAFLVDHSGLVRWSAHGKPTETELKSMNFCTSKLIGEVESTHKH
ncbi:uncharacterized protein LOC134182322 [Corticium candelabrum]|uniref:uncharacterized protein LOC134182322 n=1 Tax=Corticium candelabrum TaxID=121492 RepID=UPI002E265128|nr:uncharacterized protein LOC134182322 [Corticium candelabrum]